MPKDEDFSPAKDGRYWDDSHSKSDDESYTPSFPIKPYQFEPEYTKEEMKQFEAKKFSLSRNEEMYKGRKGTLDWCLCSTCKAMESDKESTCCKEINNIGVVMGTQCCITLHPSFEINVLGINQLNILRHQILLCTTNKFKERNLLFPFDEIPNRWWQYLARKMFRFWIDSQLNPGNKTVLHIPSCALIKISECFPITSPNEEPMTTDG